MATRVRRSREQLIADLEARLEKLKSRPSISAEHADIVKIIKLCEKTAGDNSWAIKDVVRVVSEKLAPKVKRVRKAKTENSPA